ncbi:hypothetical protein N0V86_008768 [Didymella sp. IMI 355093]|nr:hypothetical protein N0V86_008768 [Didymella sp. IMI 355093]
MTQRHTDWLDKDVANDFGKYWISWPHAGTSAKIPENLHEHLRSALLMQNLCEWAVIILLQSVKCIVTRREYLQGRSDARTLTFIVDPQAQIYQMVVAPRRRFQIMDDSNIIAGTHSLFLISSPLAGDFVLDPTAEQYGIPREHRFLPWSVYKQLYIIDQRKYCGAAVWSTNFYTYVALLQKSARWEFWTSIRAVFDKQTAAWLQDCELRTVMDDHDQWKVKQEQLKSLVVEGLAGVEPEP